jgi:hypothetical protein
VTHLASRTLFSSSRSAISVALAISTASLVLERWSRAALCAGRDTSRRASAQRTSLKWPRVLPTCSSSSSSVSGLSSRADEPALTMLCFLLPGVLVRLPSLFGPDTLPLACRRVMPPRSLRISSTRWMPSAVLGFLGRMYRSRWRPRLDEVKFCPQNGQLLSLAALSCGSAAERGVVFSEASPMVLKRSAPC